MNTSEKNECKRCGAVVPTGLTEELCPACLMSGALVPLEGDPEVMAPAPDEAPPSFEYAEFPCEFGEYRLLGLLGRGGMGRVYDAEQITTGRRVALKMLGQQLDTPDLRKRFLREGRLAAGVNHPNSLYVFGSEEIEGLPVITMEIAGSGTLKDRLKKRGPLPVAEAVDAILDVISGLEAALAGGVLHRDIKPSNCFVSPDGSVKVGDFGLSVSTLSRTDSFVTVHGQIMGTPAYAAPEQLRGDALDLRADIYSVGATLFTLLTDRAPFEGDNAVQVVANAIKEKPKPLAELREDVPPGLERVVARCLAKEPDGRYADYKALRNALLPFSSREPEPASMKIRAAAGWIDYLIALLVPYVVLMFLVGGTELLVRPLVERTLFSAKYYLALFGVAFLYFGLAEGIWGAGVGKRLRGLRVIRADGRPPGIGRALLRIVTPILAIEGVRMPLMLATISTYEWTGLQTAWYVIAANICGWIPALLAMRARRENRFTTVWDRVSGTRVVIAPKGTERPVIEAAAQSVAATAGALSLGPYQVTEEMIPGEWLVATDPILRRQVWLLRRESSELSADRRNLARHGRLRWLQEVKTAGATWDAFDAVHGVSFSSLVDGGKQLPWASLRHWLHDLAFELWQAAEDDTLPTELSLDHVWISADGHAVLLDEPWPGVKTRSAKVPVGDLAGQQRFLNAVAAAVESTSLPLHARPVLQNLAGGKFEKLSFLAGTLRGLLDRPAEVNRGVRAGAIFMLPLYVWILVFLGRFKGGELPQLTMWDSTEWLLLGSLAVVLGIGALMQLLELPLSTTVGHTIFRLAVVNAEGERASKSNMLVRWAITWLPLILPMLLVAWLIQQAYLTVAFISALVLLLLWIGAAVYAVMNPNRGLHDRLAGTWVVRR
jgi:uncharacterized RDD family membrane protein YckC